MRNGESPGDEDEEFRLLFAELEELETRQMRSDRLVSDVARRDQIEHRLLTLVSTISPTLERRRFRRVACDLWVEVHTRSGTASGAIVDIGVGGALVHTELRLRQHEEVRLVVERQPGLFEHGIEVHGVAAWLEEDARGPRPGVGISFAATQAEETARLRHFVLALMRKGLTIPLVPAGEP